MMPLYTFKLTTLGTAIQVLVFMTFKVCFVRPVPLICYAVSDIQPKNEPKEVWAPLTKGQLHLQITFVEAALATEFEGFGKTKFFANVVASRKDPSNVDLARDYIIIVDKSGYYCDTLFYLIFIFAAQWHVIINGEMLALHYNNLVT